jgi:hypothetical protein
MVRFKLYKHRNNTDVAFSPSSVSKKPNGDLKLEGDWFNIVNPIKIFFIDHDKITIKKKDILDWEVCSAR